MNSKEFEIKWVKEITNGLLKSFPNDFIEKFDFELIDLPGKPLMKGSELFGNFEIIDTDGEVLLSTDNIDKIKYLLYANRNNPLKIKLVGENNLSHVVKAYEKHLDEIVKMINADYKKRFPSSEDAASVSSKIFQLLNLHRH